VRIKKDKYTGYLMLLLLCISFIIGGMWGGIVGGGLVLWAFDSDKISASQEVAIPFTPTVLPSPSAFPTSFPTATPTPVMLPTPTPSIEDAVEKVLPSVVTVINYQKDYGYAQSADNKRIVGSGVIVDERGYIVTNAHVIADSDSLEVVLANGQEVSATMIVANTALDLALLATKTDELVAGAWGDSSKVRLGQPVLAIGSALGDFPNSVTMGIVSGLNRALALDEYVVYGLIQTDAAINQGNSGGPLINLEGEIVGINTFIIREDHNQEVAQGIGFAIPASSIKAWLGPWVAEGVNEIPASFSETGYKEEKSLPTPLPTPHN
jgi:S1-C subfamily serine protease